MQCVEGTKDEPAQSPELIAVPVANPEQQVRNKSPQSIKDVHALEDAIEAGHQVMHSMDNHSSAISLVDMTDAVSERTEKSISTSEKTTQTDFNTRKLRCIPKEGVDEDVREAFQQQRFRLFILRMEQKFTQFIGDSTLEELVCPAASPYERRLTHKLADYFLLDHMTDSPNACVKVFRSEQTKIPGKTVSEAIGPDEASSNMLPQPTILRRNISSTVASDRGSDRTRSPDRMSKTSSNSREDAVTISTNASSTTPSIVEKKDAYEAARARIFADFSELSVNKKSGQHQRLSERSSTRSSDDDFSARSSYQLMPATSNPDVYSWLCPVTAAESQSTWRQTPVNKDGRSQSSTPQSHRSDGPRPKNVFPKKQETWQAQPQQFPQPQFSNCHNNVYPNNGVLIGGVPNQMFNVPPQNHLQGPFLITQPGYIVVPGPVPVYPLQAAYQTAYSDSTINGHSVGSKPYPYNANHSGNGEVSGQPYPQQIPMTSHSNPFIPQTLYRIENFVPSNGYMASTNYTMAPPLPNNALLPHPAVNQTPPIHYQTNNLPPRPQPPTPWQPMPNSQMPQTHHIIPPLPPSSQALHGNKQTLPRPILNVKEPVGVEVDGIMYYDRKQKQEYEAASGRKLG